MSRSIFVVSDLHMGDGGPCDNFAHMAGGWRETEFNNFLDYVEDCQGELIILGDLFELWQANMSAVITHRYELLDRLAEMKATYILGNHDIDLLYFRRNYGIRLDHPLFQDMKTELKLQVANREILLIHGHEQDAYCRSEVPGVGRLSAIYTGLKEDRNGGPLHKKYQAVTIEAQALRRINYLGKRLRWLLGRPSMTQMIRREIVELWKAQCPTGGLIFGHTHEAGQFHLGEPLPIFNTGTWAEEVNSFAHIDGKTGEIMLYDWKRDTPTVNSTPLNVK